MAKLHKDFTGIANIEDVRKGAWIRKVRKGEPTQKQYQLNGYCRFNRKYEVVDLDDHCADSYLKKGTKVFVEHNF